MNRDVKKKKNFIHDNPFSCAVCRKAFARKVGLRTHIRKTKHCITKQWPPFLKSVLPREWSYNIISFSKHGPNYKVKILFPDIVSVSELRIWMDHFIKLSQCVYIRVGRKKNRSGLTPYSEFYRCQHFHQKKNGKKRSKGTGCKSSITASIKCDFSSSPYYTIVSVNFVHNHPIYSGETLRFRKPSAEVEMIFKRMLEDGLSPAHALRNFMTHLEFLPADLYLISITDRTKCPDYNWVHHFCSKLFKKAREPINSVENVEAVIKFIDRVNAEFCNRVCCFQGLENHHFAVAILTPLMKRGLENTTASEMIFIDTVGGVDKFGVKIYLLFSECHSIKIPLGVIITTQETQAALEKGLRLYLLMTDSTSFGGRGRNGPIIFLYENSKIEARSLKLVFAKSSLQWSTFHFLRSTYLWLLNSKYHVNKDDLSHLYTAIRQLVYSVNEEALESNYNHVVKAFSHNPHVVSYLKNMYDKKSKWAICYRMSFLRRDMVCGNGMEPETQILMESILDLVKAQSPCALIQYFVTDYDNFYKKKLTDNCVDLNRNYFMNRFMSKMDPKNYAFGNFLNSESLYYVYNKSKKNKYLINMDIGMCTCYVGVTGNFCKHQQILLDASNKDQNQEYSFIVEPKILLYYIATGNREISQSFFDSLQPINTIETDIQYAVEVVLKNDDASDSSYVDEIEQNIDNHVVEEILIEVQDDDVSEQQINFCDKLDLPNKLRESFRALVAKLREDEDYYEDGVASMYDELKKLKKSSAADRLAALHSFNKNWL